MAGFEGRFDTIYRRFDSIDQRFDAIDRRVEAIDPRFETGGRRPHLPGDKISPPLLLPGGIPGAVLLSVIAPLVGP